MKQTNKQKTNNNEQKSAWFFFLSLVYAEETKSKGLRFTDDLVNKEFADFFLHSDPSRNFAQILSKFYPKTIHIASFKKKQ